MGIATTTTTTTTTKTNYTYKNYGSDSDSCNFIKSSNSMSHQDYQHQNIYSFSNGFEISRQEVQDQIVRDHDKLRPYQPPLVAVEEEPPSTSLPVYETVGILSEMFNFPLPPPPTAPAMEWYGQRQGDHNQMSDGNLGSLAGIDPTNKNPIPGINNVDSMQLFLMNPQQNTTTTTTTTRTRSISPSMNMTSSIENTTQQHLTWVQQQHHHHHQGQEGLSLSLSTSLQRDFEKVAVEEAHARHVFLYNNNNQALGITAPIVSQFYKDYVGHCRLGLFDGSSSYSSTTPSPPFGVVNVLRNSKYTRPVQELLEEFCSVNCKGQLWKTKLNGGNNNTTNSGGGDGGDKGGEGGDGGSSSGKDVPPLSPTNRIEHQRRKVKLLSMLDEVDRRYNRYCEQMQTVVNSFDLMMGYGAAIPYTALAQKAMSRHFRCLKDAISEQLKHSCELLGEKDATGGSGITKGETPKLKLLEQSLRQQRAFNQMGMMEQEAWRPLRGLPDRSVNVLRAWLFEHFLHPYPSDADKLLLARQTGLSRNQVSNWFINARVRLWKPMIEEMCEKETKEEDQETAPQKTSPEDKERKQNITTHNNNNILTQTATPPTMTTTSNVENDPSFLLAINNKNINNTQRFSEIGEQPTTTIEDQVATPPYHDEPLTHGHGHYYVGTSSCIAAFGDQQNRNLGSSFMRLGSTTVVPASGDVSLTLGLRHIGSKMPDHQKSSSNGATFSLRDFEEC